MRVLLTTVGSSGDINPFIALSRRLKERGHDPVLAVNPHFRPTVERAGIEFREYGDDISPRQFAEEHPEAFGRFLGPVVLFRRFFLPRVGEMYEGLVELVEDTQPVLLVGHQISFGLPWVAERFGLPWATCPLAPATVPSVADPNRMPVGADLHRMPMWYRRFAVWAMRASVSVMFDAGFNKTRRRYGIPKRRHTLFGEMLSGDALLGLWSPAWRGPAADDPENLTICGFPWFDRHDDEEHEDGLEPALREFLEDGEAPLVFAFGSVLSHMNHDAFEEAVHACERLGARGVLVTGSDETAPEDLPAGVIAVNYAPYSTLFPRASAVVHHGGVGTTAQGLRAGVPTAIMPHAHDQFDNAARCERHGTSVTVRRHGVSGRQLADALAVLLEDPSHAERARSMGGRIRAEDGVGEAARVLEQIAGSARPITKQESAAAPV